MKVKKFNESSNFEYTFKTEIDQISIDITRKSINQLENIDKKIDDLDNMSCTIYWDYEIETGSYGIKGISPSIKKIILFVDTIEFTEGDDIVNNLNYEFDNSNCELEIETSDTVPFYPQEIQIEAGNNISAITIKF